MKALLLTALSLAIVATGCASTPSEEMQFEPGDPASTLAFVESQGWEDVAALLEDGRVTAEENTESHQLWRACREALGFSFGPMVLDPVNGKLYLETEEYRGTNDPDGKANDECYARYSDTAELVYQSTTPSKMDPSLLAAVQNCLDEAGYTRPQEGEETRLRDFYPAGEMWEPGDPVNTCVEEVYWDLYPGIPGLAYAFTLAD